MTDVWEKTVGKRPNEHGLVEVQWTHWCWVSHLRRVAQTPISHNHLIHTSFVTPEDAATHPHPETCPACGGKD